MDRVAEGFMVAPTSMTMEMHMFGAMYAATDDLTVMAMFPYLRKSMDHITNMGVKFTTKSEGLGDIRLTGLYKLFEQDGHYVHLNTGLSFPQALLIKKMTPRQVRIRTSPILCSWDQGRSICYLALPIFFRRIIGHGELRELEWSGLEETAKAILWVIVLP